MRIINKTSTSNKINPVIATGLTAINNHRGGWYHYEEYGMQCPLGIAIDLVPSIFGGEYDIIIIPSGWDKEYDIRISVYKNEGVLYAQADAIKLASYYVPMHVVNNILIGKGVRIMAMSGTWLQDPLTRERVGEVIYD